MDCRVKPGNDDGEARFKSIARCSGSLGDHLLRRRMLGGGALLDRLGGTGEIVGAVDQRHVREGLRKIAVTMTSMSRWYKWGLVSASRCTSSDFVIAIAPLIAAY